MALLPHVRGAVDASVVARVLGTTGLVPVAQQWRCLVECVLGSGLALLCLSS